MEIEWTTERPKRRRGRAEGVGMAADILKSLETTLGGGAIQISIPPSWMGKKRSPHTYAHGNLSKKVKLNWPGYMLRTRVEGDKMVLWLEARRRAVDNA